MNKYSDEFKIKTVQMVLNGNAVKYVCRILGNTRQPSLT